jgi:pimeloyl-ACP methyl ester carboxylesterase
MTSVPQPLMTLTIDDLMQDLEAGRSLPLRPADRLTALRALPRPTLGGRAFLRTYLTARAVGRLHPRLARRWLLRLWFTPWVHPSALKPVDALPGDLVAWSLETSGPSLHGFAGGTGPTVVLVHGWAGRAADWRHLAHDLVASGWRVVAPDLPAHGMTPGRQADLFELGRALGAVLDHERPVAVVTHSMGFPTTMVAIEAGAPAPSTLVALAPGRRIAHAVEGFAQRARLRPALVAELRRGIEARYGGDIWDVLDVDRVLPTLDATGLVIHDADDDEVSLADAQHIAQRWSAARLVTTEGLGHRRIVREASVRALVVEALAR